MVNHVQSKGGTVIALVGSSASMRGCPHLNCMPKTFHSGPAPGAGALTAVV
jgi:hypothetical protein